MSKAKGGLQDLRYFKGQDVLMQAQEDGAVLGRRTSVVLAENRLSTLMWMWIIHPTKDLDSMWTMFFEADDVMHSLCYQESKYLIQEKDNVIRDLKVLVANVNDRSCEPYNAKDVTALIEQNGLPQLRSKSLVSLVTMSKPKVLGRGMYAIALNPYLFPLRKYNRSAHLKYSSHLNEGVETVREIELLEYVIGTCPKSFNERDNKAPSTPVTRKKQVTFSDKPGTSSSNTQKHEVHQKVQQTNIPVIPSTGVNASTEQRRSKLEAIQRKIWIPAC
ncbi:hypothetical protein Tco_0092809 [Tanacetum coccineum]